MAFVTIDGVLDARARPRSSALELSQVRIGVSGNDHQRYDSRVRKNARLSGTECAIVGTSYAISSTSNETDSYTEQALESMITAVKEAQVTIRRDECPAYITTDDEEGTHASPA